jgi:hypothetical protein
MDKIHRTQISFEALYRHSLDIFFIEKFHIEGRQTIINEKVFFVTIIIFLLKFPKIRKTFQVYYFKSHY